MLKTIIRTAFLAIGLSAGVVTTALAANPVVIGDTAKGKTLVDARGMTLYTFDKDSDGKSACNGTCTTNWPPVAASADDKSSDGYSVIVRNDGGRQWAYKGRALYTWAKDTKPGDITGDGFLNGAWHVAQP